MVSVCSDLGRFCLISGKYQSRASRGIRFFFFWNYVYKNLLENYSLYEQGILVKTCESASVSFDYPNFGGLKEFSIWRLRIFFVIINLFLNVIFAKFVRLRIVFDVWSMRSYWITVRGLENWILVWRSTEVRLTPTKWVLSSGSSENIVIFAKFLRWRVVVTIDAIFKERDFVSQLLGGLKIKSLTRNFAENTCKVSLKISINQKI